MDIDLLLAHADDDSPAMEQGLSLEAAADAPRPERDEEPRDFRYDAGDPDSLPDQRWGLVVPEGPRGDRLLELVEPLRRARREEQDADVVVYRAAPGLDAEAASRWWDTVYGSEDIAEADVPRYLLILGDADLVSWELQQRLASDAFTGRVCFPAEQGYEAYVHKLLSAERGGAAGAPRKGARALLCTAKDGTPATRVGHQGLLAPALSQIRADGEKGAAWARDVTEIGQSALPASDLLSATAADQPTLLFSISNGCGAPKAGWKSQEEQLRMQGAMVLGGGERLAAEDVASRPFLPGGAWFYFACYGAGTPQRSAYHHWLSALRSIGVYGGDVDSVLRALPGRDGRPFTGSLPQAALANERGPLAVMGHVDLAWTFSFQDTAVPGRYRTSRFMGVFRAILEGKRIGAAYQRLQGFFNQASVDLTTMYDQEARRKVALSPEEEKARRVKKALLWMLRQDLSAYVLLGDPAARLALR